MSGSSSDKEVKQSAYEIELAKIAREKWHDYQARWKPFEEKAIKDVTHGTNRLEKMVAGKVNADLAQNFQKRALPAGVDPSSGASVINDKAVDLAEKGGRAASMATQQVRDTRAAGLKAAVDIGRGQSTDAQLGISSAASTALNEEIGNAYDRFQEGDAIVSGMGMAAGAGAAWASSGYPNPFRSDKALGGGKLNQGAYGWMNQSGGLR